MPVTERHPKSGETASDDAKSMVQRLLSGPVGEVERVIGELTRMRDMLRSEGERVQGEISGYEALSEVATKSMKIVAERLGEWQREATTSAGGFKGNRH